MVDVPDNGEKKFWNTICFNNIETLAEGDDFERWVESPAKHLIQDPFTKTILGAQIEHDGKLLNVRALNVASFSPAAATRPARRCCATYPQYPVAYTHGSIYNTGDGINMGIEVGAQLWHMGRAFRSLGPFP